MAITINPKDINIQVKKSIKLIGPKITNKVPGFTPNGFPLVGFDTSGLLVEAKTNIGNSAAAGKLELGFINMMIYSLDENYYETNDPADGALTISWTRNKFWPCYDSAPGLDKGNWYNYKKNARAAGSAGTLSASFWDKPAGGMNIVEIYKRPGKPDSNYRLVESKTKVDFLCVLAYLPTPTASYIPLYTFNWSLGFHIRLNWRSNIPWRNLNAWQIENVTANFTKVQQPVEVKNAKFSPANLYNMVIANSGKRTACIKLQDQRNKGKPAHLARRLTQRPVFP